MIQVMSFSEAQQIFMMKSFQCYFFTFQCIYCVTFLKFNLSLNSNYFLQSSAVRSLTGIKIMSCSRVIRFDVNGSWEMQYVSGHLFKFRSISSSIIIIIIISFFEVDFYITFHNYKKHINVNLPRKLNKNSDTKWFANSLM